MLLFSWFNLKCKFLECRAFVFFTAIFSVPRIIPGLDFFIHITILGWVVSYSLGVIFLDVLSCEYSVLWIPSCGEFCGCCCACYLGTPSPNQISTVLAWDSRTAWIAHFQLSFAPWVDLGPDLCQWLCFHGWGRWVKLFWFFSLDKKCIFCLHLHSRRPNSSSYLLSPGALAAIL